jgi:hypothetical protein
MAEPNLTVIRGGLLALVSAHPRTSLAALLRAASSKIWRSAERPGAALLRAARLMVWRSAERPPAAASAAGVLLTLLTVVWL